MEAGFQHRSRTMSSPRYDCYYMPCARSKTSDRAASPYSTSQLHFPQRQDTTYRHEPTNPSSLHWKQTPQTRSWVGGRDDFKPVHKQTTEEWVNEQIHMTDRSNYERRDRPLGKEELRERMWDELLYEYEAEAQRWMKHEVETCRRAQEQGREETRRRIVQEDISRIQARVRQRRDSERQAIADERRRSAERAKEKVRREQARAGSAMLEAWKSYESRWAAVSASSEPLDFHNIPWPLLTSPARVADITAENVASFLMHPAHSSNHSRRERIRSALLRWHPDRFHRMFHRVVDSDMNAVEEGVGVVARCLNELLAKEGQTTQQGK
ncbi:hypothetical protein PAXRUDRAFT_822862 [Paxillus rubicundulus Ve08.2h10]|uniref:Uncharacterized protein n=1 Tax=Paxillus rubicundulus Ve08.2h10 TaxID=930991 RepID=A0A0D0E9D6_9AGAM|nr:hypothetical protein PAXRUDRAFT_822862 [Paxillus rubicundulus Ve08.2h10]